MRSYIPLLASLLIASTLHADDSVQPAQAMQRAVLIEQDPERIRALVKAGFNIDDPIGCGTFSSLDGAVTKENPALVELLLSLGVAQVNELHYGEQTALMVAREKRNKEISDLLLAAGAHPVK